MICIILDGEFTKMRSGNINRTGNQFVTIIHTPIVQFFFDSNFLILNLIYDSFNAL